MILLVDAGNTRVKWAGLEQGELGRARSVARANAHGLDALAREWERLEAPERVLVANVAGGDFAAQLGERIRSLWQQSPDFVVPQRKACGVTSAYTEPARLGADRWASLIAARRLSKGAVCVIDCGTALTVDVMAANGEHLGGLIIPGLGMMRQALVERTGGIAIDLETAHAAAVSLFARDTEGAVMGGTLYTLVAVIDRVMADVSEAIGAGVHGLLTGGDAATVQPLLASTFQYEPDLVLNGLALLSEEAE